ncbi:hypothetical protein [Planktothrix sp.]
MIRVSLELETDWGMYLHRGQFRYFPGFFSFIGYKRLDGSTEKIGEISCSFKWDLIEYQDHYQWVKNAWFDNTIKPPYDNTIKPPYVNLSDYDPIPF